MPLVPNGPLKIGTKRVVMPTDPRGPTAIAEWASTLPTVTNANVFGKVGSLKWWGLYDSEDGVRTPTAATARRGIYGLRESQILIGGLPVTLTSAGGVATDSDGQVGYGYTTGEFGRPGAPIRQPKSLLMYFNGNNTAPYGVTFFDDFLAAYESALKPLGVEAYACFNPCSFVSLIPAATASVNLFQGPIVIDDGGNTLDLYELDVTTLDPTDLQGGDVLAIAIGGGSGGYGACNLNFQNTIGCYLIESFYDGTLGTPEPINGGTLLASAVDGSIAYDLYARADLAAAEAALLAPVVNRCRRFAFDAIGLPGGGASAGNLGATNDAFTAADADAILRNGIPGLAYDSPYGDAAALITAIIDRAVDFFS